MHFKNFWKDYKEFDRVSTRFYRKHFLPMTLLEILIYFGTLLLLGFIKVDEIKDFIEYLIILGKMYFETIKEKVTNN